MRWRDGAGELRKRVFGLLVNVVEGYDMGRAGNRARRARLIVGRVKIGPGQNWPGFFGPKF